MTTNIDFNSPTKTTPMNVIPLLYIYAKTTLLTEPVDDILTHGLEEIFNKDHLKHGVLNGYIFKPDCSTLGVHHCPCGSKSECRDYIITTQIEPTNALLRTYGVNKQFKKYKPLVFATNSLCVHYLRYHRHEIPDIELKKVMLLLEQK
jgi:hypothetical protein